MAISAANPRRPGGAAKFRVLILLAILAFVGGVVWFAGNRMADLNRQLKASEERAERVNEKLREYSADLEAALHRAREATDRAAQAEEAVLQAQAEREIADRRAAQAATHQDLALMEAARARMEARESQRSLEEIRQRREEELDRMREALSRIAPTERTVSGMVVRLAEDEFRFDFDKATLRPENRETLSRIAGILLASDGYRLFVDGHTDDQGPSRYNQELSERRARAVRDYLVNAGVSAEVIETKGFGKTQPLAKASTPEARAQNRRVEIGIVDTIVHYDKRVGR